MPRWKMSKRPPPPPPPKKKKNNNNNNTRGTAFRLVSDLTSHAHWKCLVPDSPGIRAIVFIWYKYPARLPRSRQLGQPAFSYEHIEIFVKKRVTRRDFGNRASPVDRARMKRPCCFLFDFCDALFSSQKCQSSPPPNPEGAHPVD